MTPQELKERLEKLAPDTEATVMDMTGTQDHYQVVVISPVFEGKMTMDRHRMVMKMVQPEVDSGELHALSMRTFTPEQFKNF